jgi:hypothetical protein
MRLSFLPFTVAADLIDHRLHLIRKKNKRGTAARHEARV